MNFILYHKMVDMRPVFVHFQIWTDSCLKNVQLRPHLLKEIHFCRLLNIYFCSWKLSLSGVKGKIMYQQYFINV